MATNLTTTVPETVKAAAVYILPDNLRMLRTDAKSIRPFLRRYDKYRTKVLSRERERMTESLTTEDVRPVELNFCIDTE